MTLMSGVLFLQPVLGDSWAKQIISSKMSELASFKVSPHYHTMVPIGTVDDMKS